MRNEQTFDAPAPGNWLARYLARFDDGELIRWTFRGLLAGAVLVIGLDLKALYDERMPDAAGGAVYVEPALAPAQRPASSPELRRALPAGDAGLRQPLRFVLGPDGVMSAVGSIDQGAARRFAAELAARGGHVATLSVNSPGGSLDDAMEMARLVRERGIGVEVADGAVCASSCPLLLAGGVTRHISRGAAIGLHQFYSATGMSATDPARAMSDAQTMAARISRYLIEMGVDPALWLHALDTPPQTLYYLSREEMTRYGLVTAAPSGS